VEVKSLDRSSKIMLDPKFVGSFWIEPAREKFFGFAGHLSSKPANREIRT
jgi:hypothetical protein